MTAPPPPPLPSLPLVAARLAHDLRGPLGVVVSALHELEQELQVSGAIDVTSALRLLHMARRGTRKLERAASRLDAVAHENERTAAHVDLLPLVQRAAERTAQLEHRADVPLQLPKALSTVRVRVVPHLFSHALEDVLAWSLKRSRDGVDVEFAKRHDDEGDHVEIVVTVHAVDVVPTAEVPLQDPLGLAKWLLAGMDGGLTIRAVDGDVVVVVTVPAGPAVGGT
jgi:signal transduction histidine kinase